jgi:putative ABC transport system permease protein
MERFIFNLKIALEALIQNKLRSLLTALGIIFGVASVIAMMAIGQGAQQEILEQINLVGVNNIVIKQKEKANKQEEKEESNGKKDKKEASLGLTILDGETIKQIVPGVIRVSPEVDYETFVLRKGVGLHAHLVGVQKEYFAMHNLTIAGGALFNAWHSETGAPVCIIGKGIKTKFFAQEESIGKEIKCGKIWLTVLGVLENRNISEGAKSSLGIRDNNMDIYTPVETVLLRYKNRALITKSKLNKPVNQDENGNGSSHSQGFNQVDKLIVQLNDSKTLQPVADVISTILKRRHNNVIDFEVSVPELLLKQQQRTKKVFNIVLGVIAGISLLVGGIGIMNIMLVSVMERLKEIGLRMALGATKKDVVLQFLAEAILISLMGGLAGIVLGILISVSISRLTEILTIISVSSIIVSFGVAAAVGLIFGIAPARKAAIQDPIESLRHE